MAQRPRRKHDATPGPARGGARAIVLVATLTAPLAAGTSFQFAEPTTVPFPTEHLPTRVAAADLEGNGTIDLVISGRGEEGLVYIARGLGDGTFAPLESLVLEFDTDWVEIRDFDGDTHLDLALAVRELRGRVAIVPGDGLGGFAVDKLVEYQVGRETLSLAAADFDGDGDEDIVAQNLRSADIAVLLNDGAGDFVPGQVRPMNRYTSGIPAPQQMIAGDLDGDGDIDLVVSATGANRVNILRNDGSAHFAAEMAYASPIIGNERGAVVNAALGDIDNDGDLDIVSPLLLVSVAQHFRILLNDADANFDDASLYEASLVGTSWSPALADLDGDDDLDVIVGYALPGPISLHANEGGSPPSFLPLQLDFHGDFIRHVLPVDLDTDGDVDLVLAEFPGHELIVLLNETPQGVPGTGPHTEPGTGERSGSLGGAVADEAPSARRAAPSADRNGDGRIDAVDLAIELGGGR